jgi:hypothetical protein
MKTMKYSIWISSALLITAALGCQRESNPVRNYSVAQDQGIKYVPGAKTKISEQPDNRQFVCRAPLNITVIGDAGDKLLKFVEGRKGTYQIKVGNTLDRENGRFDVVTSNPDVKLEVVARAANLVTYELSWTPGRVKAGDGVDNYLLKLSLVDAGLTVCGTDISVGLNMQVVRTADNPMITFEGLPTEPINVGDKVPFKIIIYDPASVQNQAPDLKSLSFPAALRNGERQVLNAVPGLSCGHVGQPLGEAKFQFTCTFDSARIDIKPAKGENLEMVEAQFAAEAVSKRNRKSSGPVTAGLTLRLPKKENVAAKSGKGTKS